MDYYKCEKCGRIFDEFEMNFKLAQIDKKCWCEKCRESKKEFVILKYTDVDFKIKKLELENKGFRVCAWANEGIGFSKIKSSPNEDIFK